MSPPFFSKLSKSTDDLLTDDYGTDRIVKIEHESDTGVSVTAENILGQNALSAKLTTKYLYAPWNLSLDELVIDPKGGFKGKASLDGLSSGLKLKGVADSQLKGEGGFEYTTSALALKTDIDLDITRVTSSVTAAFEGAVLGGMVAYKLPGDKPGGVDDVNAGVSFQGKSWCTAISTSSKLSTYNLSGNYSPVPALTAAALVSYAPEKQSHAATFGFKYNCPHRPCITARAKFTSDGVLSAAISKKVNKQLEVVLSTELSAKDFSPKWGFVATLI